MKIIIAENLKMFRKELALSQRKLAEAIGVSQRSISEWEHEKREPAVCYLWLLANLFGVPIDTLCGRTEW